MAFQKKYTGVGHLIKVDLPDGSKTVLFLNKNGDFIQNGCSVEEFDALPGELVEPQVEIETQLAIDNWKTLIGAMVEAEKEAEAGNTTLPDAGLLPKPGSPE